jgi:HPt (histidine-containing phosphotransfer) domain-containing protein
MDDYVPKPVKLADLLRKLDQWLPIEHVVGIAQVTTELRAETHQASANVGDVIDRSVISDACGGDPVDEREMLADFQRVNRDDGPRLRRAIEHRDTSEVVRLSHKIKGASRMIGAHELADVCERLERAGRSNDVSGITANTQTLDAAMRRLNRFFDDAVRVPSMAPEDTEE